MARRVVVEVQCSRCDRKEFREEPPITKESPSVPMVQPRAAVIELSGTRVVEFEDLCKPCLEAVTTHIEAIGKKIKGLSPERKKMKDGAEEPKEAPVEPKKEREAKKKSPGAGSSSNDPSP